MVRHLAGASVMFAFSSENDAEDPEIAMANDLAKMLLGNQPGGRHPAFDQAGVAQRVTLCVLF